MDLDPFVAGLDYPMYVVTTAHDGVRAGCLVGFATQCSLQPDLFLVCLSEQNHTYRVALAARFLAVHVLDRAQRELAELFGSTTGDEVDKFDRCDWRPGPSEVPLLVACPRRFVGEILSRTELGNHTGFLLRPTEVTAHPDLSPLTFSAVRDLEPGHPA